MALLMNTVGYIKCIMYGWVYGLTTVVCANTIENVIVTNFNNELLGKTCFDLIYFASGLFYIPLSLKFLKQINRE